jgi:nitroimidazol reductase NimA-like FMN-containing flavoprotein (pyridoxamine 5'-phosphate oxidase superfamily)
VTDEDDGFFGGGLEELSADECWRLLGTQQVGRIAVVVGHYPLVFPVNYAVADGVILFRTGAGTKLWAIHRSNVTVEVDEFDSVQRSGWSVMARGAAQEVDPTRDPRLARQLDAAAGAPWAPGERNHLVRVVVDAVSGRVIRSADSPAGAGE